MRRGMRVIEMHEGEPNSLAGYECIPSELAFLIAYDTGLIEKVSAIDFTILEHIHLQMRIDGCHSCQG